ncbi:MAG: hypothetical protein COA97_03050 [Flavobacteriales bacterium]|nr:MAG: hypothetical protein COA97_03050 [Flavobacteriales bacterium]
MRNLYLFLPLFLITILNSYSQNNAPIAVSDSVYITFNDSVSIQAPGQGPFYINDSDLDNDNIFIDTAFYAGQGYFSFSTILTTSTTAFVRFNYKPPLNYVGIDSIQYILRDNGAPVMYDTATIYLFVKHQEFQQLDLNNINARLGLNQLFHDATNSISAFEVPKGSGSNTIFAGNLWIAGKNQDSVYLDAVTFGSLSPSTLTQFVSRSGPIMDSMHYKQYDYTWDRLWKITSNEINYHIVNWNNGGYQPIEVITNWPAHGDTAKGQAFYLAPFIDNNSDGIYDPYDGDYPKIKGQQAIYFIYHDVNFSSSYTGGPVLNSETHYMAYAYNCPSDSAINNTIFLDYTIYNRSNLIYDSTYIGMWVDMDIGGYTDDAIGCDVTRSTFYTYNGDNVDEGAGGSNGYGNYPPSQGVAFLKGAKQDNDGMDNAFGIAPYETINGFGFGDGIPDNEHWGMEYFMTPDNSFHNNLKGIWYDNTRMVWGGNGHVSGGGTIPTKHLFPGITDPLWYGTGGVIATPTNWSGGGVGDVREIGSTGPFTFYPDSSIAITLAFVFGRDYQTTGNQAGIVVMQERIDSIRSYYLTDFVTVCGGTLSVTENEKEENALLVYPNPFNNELTINYELKNKTAVLEIYNIIGKQIVSQTITQNTTVIDLANQANGIYFVTITDGNNRMSKKVIKQ